MPQQNDLEIFVRNSSGKFQGFANTRHCIITEPLEDESDASHESILLPDLSSLKLSFTIKLGRDVVSRWRYPALFQTLADSVASAPIWECLGYCANVSHELNIINESQISILLIDKILGKQILLGLKESGVYNIRIVRGVEFYLALDDAELFGNCLEAQRKIITMVRRLNYLMLCNFVKLEQDAPLAFSYSARRKYVTSFSLLASISGSFSKSKKTAFIENRALNVGFLRQICNDDLSAYLDSLTSYQIARFRKDPDTIPLILEFFNSPIKHPYNDTSCSLASAPGSLN